MHECLLSYAVKNISFQNYDHRYFYVDKKNIGHFTCGLARDIMTWILRSLGEDIFIDSQWLNSFTFVKNNPSMLGFVVEQACLSSIAQNGIRVAGLGLDHMKTTTFNQFPSYDNTVDHSLYIPSAFNFRAIDGLILQLDKTNRDACLIPIQITIAKNHSKSDTAFFDNWDKWKRGLEEYNVSVKFLWITEEKRATKEEEKDEKKLRGRTIIRPAHTIEHVTIADLNQDIGIKKATCEEERY